MKGSDEVHRQRVTVSLDEPERLAIVRRAAERTIEEARPVSFSEVLRETLRRGLEAGSGRAA